MDGPWRPGIYNPSSACEVAPYEHLEPDRFDSERLEVIKFTKEIAEKPYDPEPWLHRSRRLRLLGYPELALGDVYKARLLVEAALINNTALGGKVNMNFGEKIMSDPAWGQWASLISSPAILEVKVKDVLELLELQIWAELMEGLIASNACSDYLLLSQEAVVKFPTDEIFPSEVANAKSWSTQRENVIQQQVEAGEMSEETMQSTLENGGVFPTAYPWITEDLASRGTECFQVMEKEFEIGSSNCKIVRSAIRSVLDTEELALQHDVFGVIALDNITSGETVLIDRTITGVLSTVRRCATCCGHLLDNEVNNTCCKVAYCSEACRETALQMFHSTLCGKNLDFIYEASNSATSNTDFSIDALLLLRVLALSVHENASHPLHTSILQRLTPAYDTNHLIIFSFSNHIITPIRILQELGIDVFANPAYDTWVLHTMRCRLQNNKHGQTLDGFYGTAINPLYSMFNHSCAPNVDWEQVGTTSTLRILALREIAKGEELYISYIKPLDMGLAERQQALLPWLGMYCACDRCKTQRANEEEDSECDSSGLAWPKLPRIT